MALVSCYAVFMMHLKGFPLGNLKSFAGFATLGSAEFITRVHLWVPNSLKHISSSLPHIILLDFIS